MAFGDTTPGTINVAIKTPQGVKRFDLTDFGPYPLWSSAIYSTTQSSLMTFFQYARGSPKPGAAAGTNGPKLDTNIESAAGPLSASDEMLIWSMRIEFFPSITSSAAAAIAIADMRELTYKPYTALYIAISKPASEGPVTFFPQGGGVYGATTQNAAEHWTNGVPAATAGRVYASPHYLGPQTPFRVEQEFPIAALSLAAATTSGRITVDGLRRRAVG